MSNSNKRLFSILAVVVPVGLAISGGFLQYGKDKGTIYKTLDSFEGRLVQDEKRSTLEIERLRIESYKRWEEIRKGMAPIEGLRQEQALTAQRLEILNEQQKAFQKDMKQSQRDTQQTLERILEKLSNR